MKSCIHTHTIFCDGADTPRCMAKAAVAAGIETLGFSGHSFIAAEQFGIPPERLAEYQTAVRQTALEWNGSLTVLCGLELDEMAPPTDCSGFDYIIGSAHGVKGADGSWVMVDNTPAQLEEGIRCQFGGQGIQLAKAYYEQFAAFLAYLRPDVVGHFDLVRKLNAGARYFDETDPVYQTAALEALDLVLDLGLVFEVNTGAVAKKLRRTPYPDEFLLRRILEKNGKVTITTDAHSAQTLTAGAAEAEAGLARLGFRTVWDLTAQGWQERPVMA
ncbi:MAG: PHP domain-containing protein [Pygmaiobacter massiliensis]|nr:PHP domain-containing protein [Pygmaiobacter massiliensis]